MLVCLRRYARSRVSDIDKLDLDNNRIRVAGARQLSSMLTQGKLQELSMSGNRLGDEGSARLAEGLLSETCVLRHLDISSNEAGEHTCKALAAAVAGPRCRLESLNISWNNLRGLPAMRLAMSLADNTSLTSLNAAWNALGGVETGTEAPEQGLDDDHVAKFVDATTHRILKNPGTGASIALEHMSRWLSKTQILKHLDLAHNRISSEGSMVLAEGLERCQSLDSLRLDGNPIHRSGARSIWMANARSSDGFGKRCLLSLSGCGLSFDTASFEPTEPAGKYVLDMRLTFAHTILRTLMKMAAEGSGVIGIVAKCCCCILSKKHLLMP